MAPPDNSKPFIPLSGSGSDGYSRNGRATATCFCGAVQLEVPTTKPGLVETFVCNCYDCRKITASMFASNFVVDDRYITYIRGRENLTAFAQSKTIATGNTMTNYFCKTCGTLMNRVSSGYPGKSVLRIGTVDDFSLHETALKPRVEQYAKNRVEWLAGGRGLEQHEGAFF
ncbi:hypothetical protein G647_01926 [Cladophialophora carrionii CBS 160.54]|uniref:CENP-V/GFA domain-containing protein n=1 Tax=Cladophialophora carrionii CBS 160.54 TaxID=1279043 RepID=V9DT25_9EURO|nr:uncharacterized protein G647_01926 [Cladophialophora carrionii CBS 160.54]ETI29473.1 hypothetical protein G647_01926 [Cladophialophora carrionii CBS 160.54]